MTPVGPFPLPSVDDAALDAATRKFADAAEEANLVDVAYTVVDTPVGRLSLAATSRGLVQIAFLFGPVDEVLDDLGRRISPRIVESPGRLGQAADQLDEYFEGRRKRFEVRLDLRLIRGFQRKVLRATRKIPYGRVATYTAVSTSAGNPRAVRAAGSALGANPIPIVIPCHRVLRSDGTLGGYGGGLDRKRLLLELEGAGGGA